MDVKRGKFITIEGVEGVGKSTHVESLCQYLEDRQIDYIATREPGGTVMAESIRDLLLSKHEETVDPVSELLLVFAARAQHLARLIIPALDKGTWVLCDRFTDATYAYQGAGRELGRDRVAVLETLVQGELRPDLTILLDLDPELGLQRAGQRGQLDRFETEQLDFFQRVRRQYLQMAAANPARYLVIDSGQELAQVGNELLARFHERLLP